MNHDQIVQYIKTTKPSMLPTHGIPTKQDLRKCAHEHDIVVENTITRSELYMLLYAHVVNNETIDYLDTWLGDSHQVLDLLRVGGLLQGDICRDHSNMYQLATSISSHDRCWLPTEWEAFETLVPELKTAASILFPKTRIEGVIGAIELMCRIRTVCPNQVVRFKRIISPILYEIGPDVLFSGLRAFLLYFDITSTVPLLVYNLFFGTTTVDHSIKNAIHHGHAERFSFLWKMANQDVRKNIPVHLATKRGSIPIVRLMLDTPGVNPAGYQNQAILNAAEYGHVEILRMLLNTGTVDPSDQNNHAIRMAAKNGHIIVVQILMGINKVNNNAALRFATEGGHGTIVRMLLDSNVSCNKDQFLQAVRNGHIDIVYMMMVHTNENTRQDALVLSAEMGHLQIVTMLLKERTRTVDMYFDIDNDFRFLQVAIQNNRTRIVPHLIDAMVDYEDQIYTQVSIEEACKHGYTTLVRTLLYSDLFNPAFNHNGPLRRSAKNGHVHIVRMLLDMDTVDASVRKNEAIRTASARGHTEVVRMLLDRSEVDPSDVKNEAVRLASKNGHTEVVGMLLDRPDVGECACNNEAIRMASANGHTEIVILLLQMSLVKAYANDNEAIKMAIRNGHTDIVKLLLTEKKVEHGDSILYASSGGFSEIVAMLLSHRSDYTGTLILACLETACHHGHVETVRELLQFDFTDFLPIRPFIVASKLGHTAIIRMIMDNYMMSLIEYINEATRLASKNGHYETVWTLLQTRMITPNEEYGIQDATENGYDEIVRILRNIQFST